MTEPTPAHEAAQRAAKRIKNRFANYPESDRWSGSGTEELTALIAAEFSPIVEKAELADELQFRLKRLVWVLDHAGELPESSIAYIRREESRNTLAAYEAAQKASTP